MADGILVAIVTPVTTLLGTAAIIIARDTIDRRQQRRREAEVEERQQLMELARMMKDTDDKSKLRARLDNIDDGVVELKEVCDALPCVEHGNAISKLEGRMNNR